jgi:outer membrane biogenesis lipoprotein LolB
MKTRTFAFSLTCALLLGCASSPPSTSTYNRPQAKRPPVQNIPAYQQRGAFNPATADAGQVEQWILHAEDLNNDDAAN